jgi:hypothetical protein
LDAGASRPWVQLTRGQAEGLGLEVGDKVWLRPSRDASMIAAPPTSSESPETSVPATPRDGPTAG